MDRGEERIFASLFNMKGGELMNKLIDSTSKTALTTASALIGAGAGAAFGTALFPGVGTAVGYLFGVGYGALFGLKAWKH